MLILVALAVLIGAVVQLALEPAGAATPGPPKRLGRVLIAWARPPDPQTQLRCYVVRDVTANVLGLWLCG